MRWGAALLILVAALVAVGVSLHEQGDRAREARAAQQLQQEVSKWQAKYSEAASAQTVRVDTARVYITKYRTLRDSLVITDTVQVERTLAAADTALVACDSLATAATNFRVVADSLIHVQRVAISWYQEDARFYRRRSRTWQVTAGILAGFIVIKTAW